MFSIFPFSNYLLTAYYYPSILEAGKTLVQESDILIQ